MNGEVCALSIHGAHVMPTHEMPWSTGYRRTQNTFNDCDWTYLLNISASLQSWARDATYHHMVFIDTSNT